MRKHLSLFMFLCLLPSLMWGCQPQLIPVNGSPGIGDPYYPELGNGGYDVKSYTIKLDVDPLANIVKGSTTITANSTDHLGSFNLDFHSLTVDTVRVNDDTAGFSRQDGELTITPSTTLESNSLFKVVIDYHGTPELISSKGIQGQRGSQGLIGWSHTEDGAINVLAEPDAASTWFPNNNHPRDKATFRFEITVPQPWMVVATGTLRETKDNGDKTIYVWEMNQPMATYLASINIDQYKLVTQPGPNGVTIRNYFPLDYPSSLRSEFEVLPDAIDFFNDWFGPYPFAEYGVVIANKTEACKTILALEVQTLSVHCPVSYAASEAVIVHELAHQWFGDSVSLENWEDIWLKEGLATYAEWLWKSKNDPVKLTDEARLQDGLYYFDSSLPVAKPAADNLYTMESFIGGALIFRALHLQVGDEVFKNILQTYTERYRFGNAGTDEFIAIAEEVSGKDLTSFFDLWLFSRKVPDSPR